MIDTLIFSRDRPMQLDACLRSLAASSEQFGYPNVVAQATRPEYLEGYALIGKEHQATIIPESIFANDVVRVLERCGDYVLCLCDDAITFARNEDDLRQAFTSDVICLCLRLGKNTTYCHPRDLHHGLPDFEERDPFIVWDWHGPTPDGDLFDWQGKEGDFGYPYSLDGTIHRRDSLLEWISGGSFINPNQMEGCVVHAIGQRRDLPPLMAAFPHSIQVGLPINVVNQTHGNRFGLAYPVETAELNERFLRGERIDIDAMDFSNIRGAHQEVKLEFTTKE